MTTQIQPTIEIGTAFCRLSEEIFFQKKFVVDVVLSSFISSFILKAFTYQQIFLRSDFWLDGVIPSLPII